MAWCGRRATRRRRGCCRRSRFGGQYVDEHDALQPGRVGVRDAERTSEGRAGTGCEVADGEVEHGEATMKGVDGDGVAVEIGHRPVMAPPRPQPLLCTVGDTDATHDQAARHPPAADPSGRLTNSRAHAYRPAATSFRRYGQRAEPRVEATRRCGALHRLLSRRCLTVTGGALGLSAHVLVLVCSEGPCHAAPRLASSAVVIRGDDDRAWRRCSTLDTLARRSGRTSAVGVLQSA